MYEELYQKLLQERERLLRELEQLRLVTSAPPESSQATGYREGRADEALTTAELEKKLALEENLRQLLREAEHALDKYRAGSYGLCDQCGQPIARERLEALPHASLCITCKTRQLRDAKGKSA